jgi:hypothetical protein
MQNIRVVAVESVLLTITRFKKTHQNDDYIIPQMD